ncbi:MAG: hypothetical protein WB621_20365 [Candidatus Acidiferrales bacterium]
MSSVNCVVRTVSSPTESLAKLRVILFDRPETLREYEKFYESCAEFLRLGVEKWGRK